MASVAVRAIDAHIKRTSRIAAATLGFTVIAAPFGLALYVASSALAGHPWLLLLHLSASALNPLARVTIFAATLLAMAPWLWGLWELRRLFLGYADGEVFTERAAVHFGNFALALMFTAATTPAALAGLSLALSLIGDLVPPSGIISFNSTEFGLILIGGVLRVIASVLRAAARLAEENASFV